MIKTEHKILISDMFELYLRQTLAGDDSIRIWQYESVPHPVAAIIEMFEGKIKYVIYVPPDEGTQELFKSLACLHEGYNHIVNELRMEFRPHAIGDLGYIVVVY